MRRGCSNPGPRFLGELRAQILICGAGRLSENRVPNQGVNIG